MNDTITWLRNDPLSIKIKGSGEFVKKECARLVDTFEFAEQDRIEELRQDAEHEFDSEHYNLDTII